MQTFNEISLSKLTMEVNTNESNPKLDINKVEVAVNELFTLIKNGSTLPKNKLWDVPTPINLVVTADKMGVGLKRVVRIALPHSLITDSTNICLIVPDLVRGGNVDHVETYYHYKDLLAENGIKNIKTILSVKQIRMEFDEYEARRILYDFHDIFFIDQKISRFFFMKFGKEFFIRRKLPITVNLAEIHLKDEIESNLRKKSFFIDFKGTTKTVQVGHTQQTAHQVAENIIAVFKNLAYTYPGGIKNIRCLLIKSPTSESLPIYTLISRNEVQEEPYTKSKLYSKDNEVEGELVNPNEDITVLSGSEEPDCDDNVVHKNNEHNLNVKSAVEEDNKEDENSDVSINHEIESGCSESDESDSEGDDEEEERLLVFDDFKLEILKLLKHSKRRNELGN